MTPVLSISGNKETTYAIEDRKRRDGGWLEWSKERN
jgi:hypothetical protein